MNPRLVGLSLAAVLVIAAAGTSLAGSATSAYVTNDGEDCSAPLDLQDNQLADLDEALVYLKKVTEYQVENELDWTLWQGGDLVTGGGFVFVCYTAGNKYALAWPDSFGSGGEGTYTLKVDWTSGVNYSGDSFTVD